jgi:hypothetical protein
MSNPLIAHEEQPSAYAGIGILDSTTQCVNAISSGDWIEAGIGTASATLDALSIIEDPAAALASYGLGWLIEHVHALSEPLDWLAGNPDAISTHAQTWGNVADAVMSVRKDYAHSVSGDLTTWQGAAAEAYRARATGTGHVLEALAIAADGIRLAVTMSGKIVAEVRDKIQKIVTGAVGALISWAVELACTGGLATPVVAEQAVSKIAQWATKIAELVLELARTIKTLMPLLRHLYEIFNALKDALDAPPATAVSASGRHHLPGRSAISRALDGATRSP